MFDLPSQTTDRPSASGSAGGPLGYVVGGGLKSGLRVRDLPRHNSSEAWRAG